MHVEKLWFDVVREKLLRFAIQKDELLLFGMDAVERALAFLLKDHQHRQYWHQFVLTLPAV